MSGSTITARRLLGPNGAVEYPLVEVEDGYITRIRSRETAEAPSRTALSSTIQSFPDATLAPAYLDIHVHGAAGHDVMEGTRDALRAIEIFLASRGVGGFFPTTVTSTVDQTLRSLDLLAAEIERKAAGDAAVPLGIHLEGPFLSPARRGVHAAPLLRQPSLALFDRFREAARGHIRLMTVAPELADALELIRHAAGFGVRCSLGHSDATAAEAEAGFRAGARSATHTFNAMRGLDHRDPGVAAYVLDNDELFAEIICDGIHVDPSMVRLFFKAKGCNRSILITDGASAMGMPDGTYRLGEMEVEVSDGRCTLGGALAGSVLSLDQAVRNFAAFTRSDLSIGVHLAAHNPATLMGLEDQWGCLAEGREANIAVLSQEGHILETLRAGRPVAR